MSSSSTRTIIGYHGTHTNNVDSIIKGVFSSNRRDDHWLGQGIYFYEEEALAKWWIDTKMKSKAYSAVIKADIEASENEILNLDKVEGLNFFLVQIPLILASIDFSVRLKENNQVKNLCFLLDLLKIKHKLGVIICTFTKDQPSYAGSSIIAFEESFLALPRDFTYKEVQICVTSNTFIRSKECIYKARKTLWS